MAELKKNKEAYKNMSEDKKKLIEVFGDLMKKEIQNSKKRRKSELVISRLSSG